MNAETQVMLWGAAVCVPLIVNAATDRGPDALGLSAMLVLIWAFERVMWVFWDPPACMTLYPVIDACAGATAFTAWLTRRKVWKLGLCALFVAQVCLHFDFWLAWPDRSRLYNYILLNNLIFACQLIMTVSPGVHSAIASSLALRRLPARVGPVHHPRA